MFEGWGLGREGPFEVGRVFIPGRITGSAVAGFTILSGWSWVLRGLGVGVEAEVTAGSVAFSPVACKAWWELHLALCSAADRSAKSSLTCWLRTDLPWGTRGPTLSWSLASRVA